MPVAIVSMTGADTEEAVEAVAGKQIVVHRFQATATGVQNFTFKSATTALTANHRVGQNSQVMVDGAALLRTANGEALNVVTDTATTVLTLTIWYSIDD